MHSSGCVVWLQNGGAAQYMRHASGQFYGLSAPVARYIKQNAPILHHYANEVIAANFSAQERSVP